MFSAAIGQIVTRDRCDDYMLEPQSGGSFGDPLWFVVFERLWASSGDSAKAARPGANIP
jgi:hypothetical protein